MYIYIYIYTYTSSYTYIGTYMHAYIHSFIHTFISYAVTLLFYKAKHCKTKNTWYVLRVMVNICFVVFTIYHTVFLTFDIVTIRNSMLYEYAAYYGSYVIPNVRYMIHL